jgi:hypothetical protein
MSQFNILRHRRLIQVDVDDLVAFLFGVALLMVGVSSVDAAEVEFDRDIRPILSDKCFFCHGPDAERREADLRLDKREGAIESVIVPGDADASELLARIMSDDETMRMPPPESNLSLTVEEKQLLRDWIAAGAEYADHWAFRPLPAKVAVPELENSTWQRNEIDRFVLQRLHNEQLTPAERAAPLRLLRRLALDLTGLPPTVDEIQQFESAAAVDLDASLDSAVERLLASTAFGEHQAIAWLDAARYADSFGYQSDQLNTQWPYRDWVVRAFNDNLPYDQFLTWQLAGDLWENPTRDQILATAFNRLHRMTNEGGSIAEEWLAENAADRVHTFGSSMLALTLECARCHDHKYDPILTRDYYSLSAFFNSIDENGMYDHAAKVPSPTLLLPTEEQEMKLTEAATAVEAAERRLAEIIAAGNERFAAWTATNPPPSQGREQPSTVASGDRAQGGSPREANRGGIPDATSTAGGSATNAPTNPSPNLSLQGRGTAPDLLAHFTFDGEEQELKAEAPHESAVANANGLPRIEGRQGRAIRCDGDHGVSVPNLLNADRTDPFTVDFWLRDVARNPLPVVVAQRTFGTDVGYNGFDLMLADGVLEARLYRVWPGNAIGVRVAEPIAQDAWQHVAVTYDGSSRAAGLNLYLNGRKLPTTVVRDKIQKSAALATHGSGAFTLGERFRDRGFKDGEFDELRIFGRALTPLEIAALHADVADANSAGEPPDEAALRELYFSAHDAPAREAAAALRVARQHFVAAEEAIHEVSVMDELPEPRPTYVLPRGAYDAPKSNETRVTRDTFAEMAPPFPADAPRDRLGLARWLTSPEHPLTARVFVNRLWANFFGRGLSATPDNFGRQGSAPSHPELLDWLARDFVDHGWDVKRLCRQIVTSATYQQDSRASRELHERDPDNALLARGPSRRLSAEQIRDLALAASELLANKQGGPPVYPYQPGQDLWRESNSMSPAYQQSTGEGLRRRSLYSVWKRTAPLPNMLVFDATSREVCTISRGRTNTPLQALVLLNDVQFVEAVRALATAVAKKHVAPQDRLVEAFLRLAGREPDAEELTLLVELYQEQLAIFNDDDGAEAATKLLTLGDTPRDESLPAADLAALTVACQAILNLDVTIYER